MSHAKKPVHGSYHPLNPEPSLQGDFGFLLKDDGRVKPNGLEIKRLRKLRSLSREQFVLGTGIALKTLRNLENKADCRCNPATLNVIAAFFGVEPPSLIKPDDKPVTHFLSSGNEIAAAKISIVSSARKVLACIGSRASDPDYLGQIESTVKAHPGLEHVSAVPRLMLRREYHEHFSRLLNIRNPHCHACGNKNLQIGIYDYFLKQNESSVCANETTALVVLPSPFGIGEYNAAVLFEDVRLAGKYASLAKKLYRLGQPVATQHDVMRLGLVRDHDGFLPAASTKLYPASAHPRLSERLCRFGL